MCGIAGLIDPSLGSSGQALRENVERMAAAITTRGPDDHGAWADESAGIALGHRRLSIIDLSPQGRQPMTSHSGRYVVSYNGEIYNFHQIRGMLEKEGIGNWHGRSDTEVMLEAIERWGLRRALETFNGMFAMALWDRRTRELTLARDRLGKKPLYYGWNNGVFLFGSELKALMAYPGFTAEIDRGALALFLRHNYIPAPYTIFKGISKLRPGFTATFCPPFTTAAEPEQYAYWSARDVYLRNRRGDNHATVDEITASLEKLLLDSAAMRMISDVPLGAFLSGGVDSSLVVALMQAQSRIPVRTFTIGFHEKDYDEAPHARAVAKHLGTDHTEFYVTPAEAMAVIPDLPSIYDEPFADSSQIPTLLVSRMARGGVTVCLSGDGGDESFGGYNRYLWAMSIWGKIGWAPKTARKTFARALTSIPPESWDAIYRGIEAFVPRKLRIACPGDRVHKMAEIVGLSGPVQIYKWLVSHYKDPAGIVLGASEPRTILTDSSAWLGDPDFNREMMYLDTVTYLPDDILTKVDRASMAVSLEARAPLLDYRVVEFAAALPADLKIRDGEGKWLLRRILYKYAPRELIERPKMGFGMPIGSWLRGPLREWAEGLLDEGRLKREGYFNPAPIRKQWEEHLGGGRNWQYYLWDVLMFQAWLEKYKNKVT